ncbi:acetylglutamate kinase [Canibacter zhoujuaniae]|uniref:acetylglutamate kinase n=1 Tax=Canibacter zhoujuaniae TaxID=2708343 RepID=UPI00141F2648|nr:acetylglutamate kinase [Canibacter zhoujuaniae]
MSVFHDHSDPELVRLKAAALVESLPWLKKYNGKIMVIKFGGNAMVDPKLFQAFAEDVVFLRLAGIRPVIVHGGGPQINEMLTKLGIQSEFRGGYRVTTPEAMEVVRMVLTGKVNPRLVDEINTHSPFAIGLSGVDAGLFNAVKREPQRVDGELIDFGQVGDIISVRVDPVLAMLDRGLIPVVSSIAADQKQTGVALNINADAAAGALASTLGAEKLVILTDVKGVYANWPDTASLISSMSVSELEELLPNLAGGMIPKMKACIGAVRGGVPQAAVIDGREPHSVLLEILTDNGIGTAVVADEIATPATSSIPVITG